MSLRQDGFGDESSLQKRLVLHTGISLRSYYLFLTPDYSWHLRAGGFSTRYCCVSGGVINTDKSFFLMLFTIETSNDKKTIFIAINQQSKQFS